MIGRGVPDHYSARVGFCYRKRCAYCDGAEINENERELRLSAMSLLALWKATLVAAVLTACFTFSYAVSLVRADTSATGQLIRIAPQDPAWSFAAAGPSFEIIYASRDQRDSVAEASGALYVPRGLAPPGGWPLVVFAHGTVGIGNACALSRRPQIDRVSAYFNEILDNGYAVLAPDDQGLGTG